MRIRVLVTLLIALPLSAYAAEREPWRATVPAPRAGLPAVTVELGYPGAYVPAINSPIVINATAADVPFTGFVGYHFAVNARRTRDVPVIFDLRVGPHASASVHSFVNVKKWGVAPENGALPRELIVEWRNRDKRVIATQNAGTPPWTTFADQPHALSITGLTVALGRPAYAAEPSALSDNAQWYAGFSSFVAPLDKWIDLPTSVREAAFSSGIYIVLYGFPRTGQRIDALDAAILPVTFRTGAGSYESPWPYRQQRSSAPVSWTVRDGVAFLGPANCPYIARTDAAAWIADDAALSRPLPSIERVKTVYPLNETDPTTFMSQGYGIIWAAGGALLLTAVAWPLSRRKRTPVVAAILIVISGVLLVTGKKFRTPSHAQQTKRFAVAPGIAGQLETVWAAGPTPIPPAVDAPQAARMKVTGSYDLPDDFELRNSATPPSMGLLDREWDWDISARWRYHRELDPSIVKADKHVAPHFADLHGSMNFWETTPGKPEDFQIICALDQRDGSRMGCLAALPPNVFSGHTVTVALTNGVTSPTAELSWAGGVREFPLAQKNSYHPKTFTIPEDVLRQIAASGGTFMVKVPPTQIIRNFFDFNNRVWIHVQEKKS